MKIRNPILATDSYKFSHFAQYPEGTEHVSSYIEARGSHIEGVTETVLFGLQAFIFEYLSIQVTHAHLEAAKTFCEKHGVPFNYDGWKRVIEVHGGYLPVEIRSVPEGTPVTLKNVLVQVVNLDPELPWVTSYIETLMLSYVWYGSTIATKSREIKKVIKKYLDETSDNPEAELPFKLHDFGYRGAAAGAADLGAAAHLVNFMGTDTVAGIEFVTDIYGDDVCGYSISASEHSTMTSWGRTNEYGAYKNMVTQYAKPGAIFACVIDSYDTFNAIDMWTKMIDGETGLTLVDQVKKAGATIVLRPDSGDPVQMPVDVIKKLMDRVGFYENSKGYRVLPNHIRVIQGDGIDMPDVKAILWQLKMNRISASNIAFGMGGGLLQKANRDTFKFAMKASAIRVNGEWRDVVKDPATDSGKKSKAGIQDLLYSAENEEYVSVKKDSPEDIHFSKLGYKSVLKTVYSSHFGTRSHLYNDFATVRKNAEVK